MAYKVKFLSSAKQDMIVAADWYDEQLPGLGLRFIRAVGAKIKILTDTPLIYVKRYELTHTALVDGFPYLIHFEFRLEKHLVVITAILHTSLNPEKWLRRQ